MERFWNIIHYFAYRADYKLHIAFGKIEPVGLLLKLLFLIPSFKRFSLKKGVTLDIINKGVDEAFKRPDYGLSALFSGIFMGILPVILLMGLHVILSVMNGTLSSSYAQPFVACTVIYFGISYFITYIFIFRHDKYLNYFNDFDKKPHKWKRKWAIISLCVSIIPFFIFILSLIIASN